MKTPHQRIRALHYAAKKQAQQIYEQKIRISSLIESNRQHKDEIVLKSKVFDQTFFEFQKSRNETHYWKKYGEEMQLYVNHLKARILDIQDSKTCNPPNNLTTT